MSITSLDLFKQYIRCDDTTIEDSKLEKLLTAAEQAICVYTGRTIEELKSMSPDGHFPSMLVQAAMMTAGYWHSQNETASTVNINEVPYGFSFLVKPFCKLTDDSREDEE